MEQKEEDSLVPSVHILPHYPGLEYKEKEIGVLEAVPLLFSNPWKVLRFLEELSWQVQPTPKEKRKKS